MKKIIFKWALRIVKVRLEKSNTHLTPELLQAEGWVSKPVLCDSAVEYFEPNVKDRDKIYVSFDIGVNGKPLSSYYRVRHGKEKTFIALQSSIEWFELYYALHTTNGR